MNAIDAYAQAVVDGRKLAGKFHRLACARHLRDRRREATPRFPYRFDLWRAERFFRFAERLPHYKGEWAGRLIRLEPYQQFRLGSLFAWVHIDTGLRRFRTAYNELPRKNGKSLEAALIALYLTFFDGEPGAEGYCMATKRDQARIVFNDAKRIVKHSALRRRIEGAFNKHGTLTREEVDAKLEPLSGDADYDGLNPNVIINDEFHAQKDRGLIDVMETALGARQQPLNFQITTAGSDPQTPCGDQHHYACQILERVVDDETFFAFIAHADPDDDPFVERTWRKANPNYGISVKPDDLKALARKAAAMPPAAAAFKQKRLNLWVLAGNPWLALDNWRAGQTTWTAEELAGEPCYLGIDMSSKIDLTALVCLFPPRLPERRAWRALAWCLTPEETMDERAGRDRAPYRLWHEQGWLRTNPGKRIDQDIVLEMVEEAAGQFLIQGIGIDPWNAGNLVKTLSDGGYIAVEVPQTMQQMSQPAKEIEADVLEGLVDGGNNPLLTWCVSNAVAQKDNKENIYPSKGKSRGRIDPVIALVIARKLAGLELDSVADDPDLVVA